MLSSSSQHITAAVDTIIFTIQQNHLCVLLIQMKKAPHTGQWAFPGGRMENNETSEETARRILFLQTGVKDVYLEQLKTFDSLTRDPLERVISIASFALIRASEKELHTTDKYQDIRWWPVKKLPPLAYDHKLMAKEAIVRLKSKIQYTNIVQNLLPEQFTLSELQSVYEIILGESIDKRNFRKRILTLNLISPTGTKRAHGASRPAELYKFKKKKMEYMEIL